MKNCALTLVFFLIAQLSLAQSTFEYDQAGNRIKRNFTPFPDLSPVLTMGPSTISGVKPVSAVVDIYELNNVATTGLITVKLTKASQINFTFNPTATSIGGYPVQNAHWSFDATIDDDYYVFTSTVGIAAGDVSSFGLSGTSVASSISGQVNFVSVIAPGSGGELYISNNTSTWHINIFN